MTSQTPCLGYTFQDTKFLKQALTHKSYHNEFSKSGQSVGNNEKLEFLGDSVLDLILSHLLIDEFPHLNEGELSKLRASLVNEDYLSTLAIELGLQSQLLLGRGEVKMEGEKKPRLLASCFEAIVGAVYLDSDFQNTTQWVRNIYLPRLKSLDMSQFYAADYKTSLQELVQKKFKITPTYTLVKQEGPDHSRVFYSQVFVKDFIDCIGVGTTKKSSEQMAAKKALEDV